MNTTGITRLFYEASEDRSVGGLVSSPDLDRYRRHVSHLDLPEARKDDMMLAVWRIVQTAVDRAFGDDPAQRDGRRGGDTPEKDDPAELSVL